MSTVAEIEQQNAVFKAAYQAGKISLTDYNKAMIVQSRKLAEITRVQQSTPVVTDPYSGNRDVSTPITKTGPTPTTIIVPITSHDASKPLEKTVSGYEITTIPKESSANQPPSSPLPSEYWASETGAPKGYTQVIEPAEQQKLTELSAIAKENQMFQKALETKQITPAEYNTAIMYQYEKTRQIEPSIPEGMVVSKVQPDAGKIYLEELKIAPNTPSSGSYFGTVEGYAKDGKFVAQIGVGMHGEPIYEIPVSDGPKGLSYAENRSLTGLTLATSAALPLTASGVRAGAFLAGTGFAGVGVAEATKYVATGQHLTTEEAINAFAIGEAVGIGAKVLNTKVIQPKVSQQLSRSYEKTLESNELWNPSLREEALMKITGAKPNSPVLQAKASNILSDSYKAQFDLNESILMNKPLPENVAGRAGLEPWTPTAKESEIMAITGAKPKVPAPSINVARVTPGESYTLTGLQRQFTADDMFDFSFTPKTSFRIENIPQTPVAAKSLTAYSKPLPVYFGLGSPYQTGVGQKAVLTEFKEVPYQQGREIPLEKGIPENQLGYDYRGSLSFKKPTAFEQIQAMNNKPSSGGPMKPLWDSVGSKPTSNTIPSQSNMNPLSVTVTQPKTVTVSPQTQQPSFAISTQKVANPFLKYSIPMYQPRAQMLEEEQTFLSVPNSVLPHPEQPKTITIQNQKPTSKSEQQILQAPQIPQPQIPINIFDQPKTQKPTTTQPTIQEPSTTPTFIQTPKTQPALFTAPIHQQITVQKTKIDQPQIPKQKMPLPPYTPSPFSMTKQTAPMLPLGAKAMEHGLGFGETPFFGKYYSTKRLYPIATAEEFWG